MKFKKGDKVTMVKGMSSNSLPGEVIGYDEDLVKVRGKGALIKLLDFDNSGYAADVFHYRFKVIGVHELNGK